MAVPALISLRSAPPRSARARHGLEGLRAWARGFRLALGTRHSTAASLRAFLRSASVPLPRSQRPDRRGELRSDRPPSIHQSEVRRSRTSVWPEWSAQGATDLCIRNTSFQVHGIRYTLAVRHSSKSLMSSWAVSAGSPGPPSSAPGHKTAKASTHGTRKPVLSLGTSCSMTCEASTIDA